LRVITGLFAVVGADGVVPVGLPAVTFPEEEGGWGKEGGRYQSIYFILFIFQM
jgi:hypothetical protein